jgi:ribonuclease P protein component
MFSKKERLPVADFSKQGERVTTPYFTIRYEKNTLRYNRYAVVVGATVSARAHTRILLKRRVRSILHTLPPRSLDILFIASPRCASLPFAVLKDLLKEAVDRLSKNL